MDEIDTSQNTSNDDAAESNDEHSFIGKMKFGVSKILPNSLSKWLSPKVDVNSARRRRHDEIDSDEEQTNRNSPALANVSDGRSQAAPESAVPPPNKKKKTFTDRLSRDTNELNSPAATSLIGERSANIASSTLIEDVPHRSNILNQFNRYIPLENGQYAGSLSSSPNTFIEDSVRDNASNYPDEASSSQSREKPTNPFAINNESSVVNFSAHLQRAKSLFTNRSYISPRLKNYRMRNPRSSLYRSTSSLCDNNSVSSNASSVMSSPFYNGQTTFGGASAISRRMINATHNTRDQQQLHHHRPKVPTNLVTTRSTSSLNSIGGSASMSNTAKRILDVMSKYNTPLTEVRRISNALPSIAEASALSKRKSLLESELDLTTINEFDKTKRSLSKPNTPYHRPFGRNPAESVLTAELHVPSMPELLQLKKFAANTVKIRDIASNSNSALNKPASSTSKANEFKLMKTTTNRTDGDLDASNNNNKSVHNSKFESISNNNANDANKRHKNKIRSNLTKRRMGRGAEDDLMPEPLNLPNVPLMIGTKETEPFQLKNVGVTKTTGTLDNGLHIPFKFKSSNTNSLQLPISKEKQTNGNDSNVNNKFNASPLKTTLNQANSFGSRNNTSCINSSLNQQHTMNNSKKTADTESAAAAAVPSTTTIGVASAFYRFTEPIVINQSQKTFVTGQPMNLDQKSDYSFSEPKFVTDKNVELPKIDTQPKSFNNFRFDPKPVNNNITSDSGIAETSLGSSQAVKSNVISGNGHDASDGKPVSSLSTAVESDDTFKSFAAKQKQNKWSCKDCLASNDASDSKCACCGVAKTGTAAAKSTQNVPPPAPVDDVFKSIVAKQKQTKWECKDCMAQNDQALNKCACCGGANPNATSNVNTTSKTEPSKPTFSFGALATSSASTSSLSTVKPTTSQPIDNVFKAIVDKQKSSSWECSACLNRNDASKSKCMCCEQSREVTKGVTCNETAPEKSQTSFGGTSTSSGVEKTSFSFGSNAYATTNAASSFSFGNLASKSNAPTLFSFGNAKNESNAVVSTSCAKAEDDKAKEPSQKPIAQFSFGNTTVLPSTNKTEIISNSAAVSSAPAPAANETIDCDSKFKSIVEKQKASSWDCATCMTKNPNEKEKCSCCETPKAGGVATDTPKKDFSFSTNPKFSFGASASSTFKFGSQPVVDSSSSATTSTTTAPATVVAASTTTSTTSIFGSNLKSSMFSMPSNKPADQTSSAAVSALPSSAGAPFLFGSAMSKDVTDTGPTTNATNKGITILDNVLVKPAVNGPTELPNSIFSIGQNITKSADDEQATKAKKRSNTELIDSNVSTKLPATSAVSTMPLVFGHPQTTNNIFGAIASNPTTAIPKGSTAPSPSFSFAPSNQSVSAFPTAQSTFSSTSFSFGANSAATAAATAAIPVAPTAFGAAVTTTAAASAVNTTSQPIFGSIAFSPASSSLPTLGGFAANSGFGNPAAAFGTPSPSSIEVQPQATLSPAFQFGASGNSANNPLSSDSQPRIGGFNFSPNTAPTFNFSEQSPQQLNVPYQFGSSSEAAPNMFSAPATANTTTAIQQRRKIRPIRRTNRP